METARTRSSTGLALGGGHAWKRGLSTLAIFLVAAFASTARAQTSNESSGVPVTMGPQAAPNPVAPGAPAVTTRPQAAPNPVAPEAPAVTTGTPPAWETAPTTRRSGFLVGFMPGFGVSQISGYPNDPNKIGFSKYRTSTGAAVSYTGGLWLGGALTDWFNFGVGFASTRLFREGMSAVGGMVFRIEAFPLFSLGGHLRDLGVSLDAGTGTVIVSPDSEGKTKQVDSGAASFVGFGALYEAIHVWHFAMGPYLTVNHAFSQSSSAVTGVIGFRAVFYASLKR